MDEIDVLKKISSNLPERRSSAALSNYRVLCDNIAVLNEAFAYAIGTMRLLQGESAVGFHPSSYLHQTPLRCV
jgi:hypothetical protein